MRYLTTISDRNAAESFVAYLLTKDVSTHVEPVASQANEWEIWIRDEDKLPIATRELQEFQAAPQDVKYQQAINDARSILKERRKKAVERQRSIQTPTLRTDPRMFGGSIPPLTLTIVLLCVFLGLATEFMAVSANNFLGRDAVKQLMFVDLSLYEKTQDPAASLKQGQLWRILTPAFLHGGPLHLLLNMLSLVSLGRITERLEGIGRYAIILILVGAGSHLLQGLMPIRLWGSPNFVGISGVVLGLLGYIGTKTTLRPDLGFQLSSQAYVMTALILLLGFTGGVNGLHMANMAHLGGLITGMAVGYVMSDRRLDP